MDTFNKDKKRQDDVQNEDQEGQNIDQKDDPSQKQNREEKPEYRDPSLPPGDVENTRY